MLVSDSPMALSNVSERVHSFWNMGDFLSNIKQVIFPGLLL